MEIRNKNTVTKKKEIANVIFEMFKEERVVKTSIKIDVIINLKRLLKK